MQPFTITRTVRTPTPRIPFENIKNHILGPKYELSLVLIGDSLARKLNKEHKGKTNPTNILSFPLSKMEGEIFINVRRAERDAKSSVTQQKNTLPFCLSTGASTYKVLSMEKKWKQLKSVFSRNF